MKRPPVFQDPKYLDAERRVLEFDELALNGMWTYRAERVRREYVLGGLSPHEADIFAYVTWTGWLPQVAEFGHFFTLWGYAAARSNIDQWRRGTLGPNISVDLKTQILTVKRPRATVETLEIKGVGWKVDVYSALGFDALRAIESIEQADRAARTVVQCELSMLAHAFGLDDPAGMMPERLPDDLLEIHNRLRWPGDPEILAGYERDPDYSELLHTLDDRPSSRWPVDGKSPIRPSIRPPPGQP